MSRVQKRIFSNKANFYSFLNILSIPVPHTLNDYFKKRMM